jgi:hypothetical protein
VVRFRVEAGMRELIADAEAGLADLEARRPRRVFEAAPTARLRDTDTRLPDDDPASFSDDSAQRAGPVDLPTRVFTGFQVIPGRSSETIRLPTIRRPDTSSSVAN